MKHTPVPLWNRLDLRMVGWRILRGANKLGLLMWSTDKIHNEMLADQLSTMEKRPHENLVLAAKGHLQYRWRRSNMREQEVVRKEKI